MMNPNAIATSNPHDFFLPMRVFQKRIQQVPIIVNVSNFIINRINNGLQVDFSDMEVLKFWEDRSGQVIAATGAGKTMMFSAILYLVTKYIRDNNLNVQSRNILIATPWIALNAQTETEIINNIKKIDSDYAGLKYLKIFIQDSSEGRSSNYSNIFHASSYANSFTTVDNFASETPDNEFSIVICCNKSLPRVNGIKFLFAIADEAHRINGGVETNKLWFDNVKSGVYLYFTATRTISASIIHNMENSEKYGTILGVISYQTAFNEGWILKPEFYCGDASKIRFVENYSTSTKKKVSALLDETLHIVPKHEEFVSTKGGTKHKLLIAADKAFACLDAITNWEEYSFGGKYLVFVAISRTPAMAEIEGSGPTIYAVNGKIIKSREDWLRLIHLCRNCIIFNYDIFKEGIDIPSLTAVIVCRNLTDNKVAMIQYAGRSFRIDTGCEYMNTCAGDLEILGNNIDTSANPYKVPQILYISELGSPFFDEGYVKTKVFESENYGYHGMDIVVDGGATGTNKEQKELELLIADRDWMELHGVIRGKTEVVIEDDYEF